MSGGLGSGTLLESMAGDNVGGNGGPCSERVVIVANRLPVTCTRDATGSWQLQVWGVAVWVVKDFEVSRRRRYPILGPDVLLDLRSIPLYPLISALSPRIVIVPP